MELSFHSSRPTNDVVSSNDLVCSSMVLAWPTFECYGRGELIRFSSSNFIQNYKTQIIKYLKLQKRKWLLNSRCWPNARFCPWFLRAFSAFCSLNTSGSTRGPGRSLSYLYQVGEPAIARHLKHEVRLWNRISHSIFMAGLREISQSSYFSLSFNLIPKQMLWCVWFTMNLKILKVFIKIIRLARRFLRTAA